MAGLLRVEFLNFEKKLGEFYDREKQIKNAIFSAVKRATKHGKTVTSSIIRTELNIKKSDIDKQIKTLNPYKTAMPTGVVSVRKGPRANLGSLPGTRQNKKGISYLIKKGGARKKIAGGFLVNTNTLPNSKNFLIRGESSRLAFIRSGKKRLPIVGLKSVSPWGVLVVGERRHAVTFSIRQRLVIEMKDQLRLAKLRKLGTVTS